MVDKRRKFTARDKNAEDFSLFALLHPRWNHEDLTDWLVSARFRRELRARLTLAAWDAAVNILMVCHAAGVDFAPDHDQFLALACELALADWSTVRRELIDGGVVVEGGADIPGCLQLARQVADAFLLEIPDSPDRWPSVRDHEARGRSE